MSFTFDEAYERLECPHIDCNYYNVRTEISGSYVEGKMTLEKECTNCQGRDHLMFELGKYEQTVEFASVGDKFQVNSRLHNIRADDGDTITVTAIAENPLYADSNASSSDRIIISVTRNIDDKSPYRTGIISAERFQKILSNEDITLLD